uniref:rRNA methyltransferase 2, mitochondrial n=1 Tax=Meloidogyne incognita TaxID=6306 RepID=A0A914LCU7_MELIC
MLNLRLQPSTSFIRYFSKRKEVERYLERQANDQYSRRAKEHSYRARSAFKLLQINEKFNFIKPGLVALDVGAAPGSWCQVLSELIFPLNPLHSNQTEINKNSLQEVQDGYILGIDLLPISPIDGVDLLCKADFLKPATQTEIIRRLQGRQVNLLLSDMAPNPIGDSRVDHFRIIQLCKSLLDFGTKEIIDGKTILAKDGIFLCKIFDGQDRSELKNNLNEYFQQVKFIKPDASRDNSSEIYIFASGFNNDKRGK